MTCTNCNEKTREKDKFCSNCGNIITNDVKNEHKPEKESPPNEELFKKWHKLNDKQHKRKFRYTFAITTFALFFLLVIVVIVFVGFVVTNTNIIEEILRIL